MGWVDSVEAHTIDGKLSFWLSKLKIQAFNIFGGFDNLLYRTERSLDPDPQEIRDHNSIGVRGRLTTRDLLETCFEELLVYTVFIIQHVKYILCRLCVAGMYTLWFGLEAKLQNFVNNWQNDRSCNSPSPLSPLPPPHPHSYAALL